MGNVNPGDLGRVNTADFKFPKRAGFLWQLAGFYCSLSGLLLASCELSVSKHPWAGCDLHICMHPSCTLRVDHFNLKWRGGGILNNWRESVLQWFSKMLTTIQPFAKQLHSNQLLDISLSCSSTSNIFVLGKAKSSALSKRKIKLLLWKPVPGAQNYSIVYCSAAGIIMK